MRSSQRLRPVRRNGGVATSDDESADIRAVRDQELQHLSRRLLHDLQVFFHVGRTLTRSQFGLGSKATWEVQTALVESFALHARGLGDFFYIPKRGSYKESAFAFDFFDDDNLSWNDDLKPPQGPWLRRIKRGGSDPAGRLDRFGQEIAHLTFADDISLAEHARGWPVVQIANEIGEVLRVFVDNVADATVVGDFKAKARREIPLAARLDNAGLGAGLWGRPLVAGPSMRSRTPHG